MALVVLCVDDQRDVLSAIADDLTFFENVLQIEECESAQEALALMDELDANGDQVAVILSDQVMPQMSGVDFLMTVMHDSRFLGSKKVLLTGQATHQDTIDAINTARIDAYIEKPWQTENLIHTLKQLLTEYLFQQGIEWQTYQSVLDSELLLKYMSRPTVL